jgi:hypothetical protein
MWASQSGPTEYTLVRYHEKWAELDLTPGQNPKTKDVAGQLSALNARRGQCVEKSERVIELVNQDLSLPRGTQPPKMISSLKQRVRPDKYNEFLALLKSDLFPAVRSSGMKIFSVAQTRYGGSRYEFRSTTGMNSWSDLDSTPPIVKAMGEENYQKFLAKLRTMVVNTEYNVYRFLPDLSYIPGGGSGSTSGGN